jgi:diguanylate cyclase (GGDEF)-like protein/PAS domain S-box-containing protein
MTVHSEPAAGRIELVDAWTAGLLDMSDFAPLGRAEAADLAGLLAGMLVAAVRATPPDVAAAHRAGVELVRRHAIGSGTLGRSLMAIGTHLPAAAGLRLDEAGMVALAAVQGAFAAGHLQAVRDLTLAEQEAIRRAESRARTRVQEALRASEARFRAVFADAGIGIGLADLEGRILEVNASFAGMLGYSPDELTGLMIADLLDTDEVAEMAALYQQIVSGEIGHARLEWRYQHRAGHWVWTNLTVSLIRAADGSPRYALAMVEDVSEQRSLRERLRHQALHDPLTGLANRVLFFEHLQLAVERQPGVVAVCYLDLDGFKSINDTLGHDVGDELLVAVGRRLDATVSGSGHLLARMGGDEFVVLVKGAPGADLAAAEREIAVVAADALEALAEPFTVRGHSLTLSASAGVVARRAGSTTAAELMKAADITLYWAKAEGRGRWAAYDEERNARQVARLLLSSTLPAALSRGEFILEYQPLIGLADGAVRGVEALIRWRHPTLGMVLPDRFIGIAEESGAIVQLGRWVLEEACQQAGEWHRAFPHLDLFMSVNLAVRQARESEIVSDVDSILSRTGLPAASLQLELTESALMGPAGRPLEALRALSARGVRIAIDDFGTGYSNLAYLRQLPVHGLKLAGSLMQPTGRPAAEIDPVLVALVNLAHTLGLTVTAEGVETQAQAEQLRDLGCDTAQGWYFARSMPAIGVTELLGRDS